MALGPTPAELIARARTDLRLGLPVVVRDGDRMALAAAAETLSPERFDYLRQEGTAALVITDWRAKTLKVAAYDGDLARLVLPDDADIGWVAATADPVADLAVPLKGPYLALRDGPADLHRAALRLVKSARLLPATLVVAGVKMLAKESRALTHVEVGQVATETERLASYRDVISARVPLSHAPDTRVHVFRPDDAGEEHYAVEIGRPDRSQPVLARLHSACFTGDVLGSLKCDCGPQLNTALANIATEGSGLLLYLNQEGRGIGLSNKLRAYALQDQGFDTVDANHRLGFEDDERDFRIGAAILRHLGFNRARLMTNNPRKIRMLDDCGITVTERVPLKAGVNALNADYLDVKARKSGHLL
ncbi:MAG: GTP cyclohydrolase II [Pseudomonadota bacterium]